MNSQFESWRVTALHRLPMYSRLVSEAKSHIDLWQELKEIIANSDPNSDLEHLRPIFDYAWWCVDQSLDNDLGIAIETYFYEDLPAFSDTCDKIRYFVDQKQFNRLRKSFSARVDNNEFEILFAEYLK